MSFLPQESAKNVVLYWTHANMPTRKSSRLTVLLRPGMCAHNGVLCWTLACLSACMLRLHHGAGRMSQTRIPSKKKVKSRSLRTQNNAILGFNRRYNHKTRGAKTIGFSHRGKICLPGGTRALAQLDPTLVCAGSISDASSVSASGSQVSKMHISFSFISSGMMDALAFVKRSCSGLLNHLHWSLFTRNLLGLKRNVNQSRIPSEGKISRYNDGHSVRFMFTHATSWGVHDITMWDLNTYQRKRNLERENLNLKSLGCTVNVYVAALLWNLHKRGHVSAHTLPCFSFSASVWAVL